MPRKGAAAEEGISASTSDPSFEPSAQRNIHPVQVTAYGVGHFYNDLCSAMWFSYLLIFFNKVLKFDSSTAGTVILIGQMTDAFATPLVGLESDRRTFGFMQRYGQRKSWHLLGTLFVTCSFPWLFMRCPGCSISTTALAMLVFYIPCVVMFQIGWASVQISHLSLIPELSRDHHDRLLLNSVRYAFTVVANLLVFGVCALLLGLDSVERMSVTPHDEQSFKLLGLIIVGVGLVFATFFHVGTKETNRVMGRPTSYSVLSHEGTEARDDKTWNHWLKEVPFYQAGVIYTCSRLFVNISNTYMPFWLLETQHFRKEFIAVVPLIVYASSFVTSSLMSLKFFSPILAKRRVLLASGFLIGIGAAFWMWFHELHERIYGVAVLVGIASALMLVTSLALTADMIGAYSESGAFVYGAMSCADKLSSGIAIQVVQYMQPCLCKGLKSDWFYRNVVTFIPGCAALIGLVALAAHVPHRSSGHSLQTSESTARIEDPAEVSEW